MTFLIVLLIVFIIVLLIVLQLKNKNGRHLFRGEAPPNSRYEIERYKLVINFCLTEYSSLSRDNSATNNLTSGSGKDGHYT